jgi:hypothetical protein
MKLLLTLYSHCVEISREISILRRSTNNDKKLSVTAGRRDTLVTKIRAWHLSGLDRHVPELQLLLL